jgi:hypothetical protein
MGPVNLPLRSSPLTGGGPALPWRLGSPPLAGPPLNHAICFVMHGTNDGDTGLSECDSCAVALLRALLSAPLHCSLLHVALSASLLPGRGAARAPPRVCVPRRAGAGYSLRCAGAAKCAMRHPPAGSSDGSGGRPLAAHAPLAGSASPSFSSEVMLSRARSRGCEPVRTLAPSDQRHAHTDNTAGAPAFKPLPHTRPRHATAAPAKTSET